MRGQSFLTSPEGRTIFVDEVRMGFQADSQPAIGFGRKRKLLSLYMQGRSFLPVLRGRTPSDWKQETYYRDWMHMSHFAIPAHYGIRTRSHKLIYYYGEPLGQKDTELVRSWVKGSPRVEPTEPEWELFDLDRDPREMHNRASDPEYAPLFAGLKKRLLEKKKAVGDTDDRYPELMAQRERYW